MNYFLGFILIYCVIIEPFLDRKDINEFSVNLKHGNLSAKNIFYCRGLFRNCVMSGVLLLAVALTPLSFGNLGFREGFNIIHLTPVTLWISGLIAVSYLLYFYFCPFLLIYCSQWIKKIFIKILIPILPILPRTKVEKLLWIINALNATSEEIVYRGFVFFYLWQLSAQFPIYGMICISVVLEALRYAPRWNAVKHVAINGFIYASAYAFTGNILVPIALHIAQDLSGLWMPVKLIEREARYM